MIPKGKCPKCGEPVLHVHVDIVNGMVANESKAKCLTYSCIRCQAVLGVQMDPRGSKRRPKTADAGAEAALRK